MTPTPWAAVKVCNGQFEWASIDGPEGGEAIADMSKTYLKGSDKWNDPDTQAIVLAVNNTFGRNIKPEAVPDLLEALEFIVKGNLFLKSKNHYAIPIEAMDKVKLAIIKAKTS